VLGIAGIVICARDLLDALAMDQKHPRKIGHKFAVAVSRSPVLQRLAADATDNARPPVSHWERNEISIPVPSLVSAPKRHSLVLHPPTG
jgi:hypothetical protein